MGAGTTLARRISLSVLMTSSFLSGTALAADRADPTALEEVTVVARNRVESLREVPISASVYSGETLAARDVTNVKDLLTITPNVSIPDVTGATNNVDVVIRGISTNTRNAGFESGAGVYLDGVYAGRSNAVSLALVGVESVEVLRGPQGTNFGKNTTAGAINIRTIQPQRGLFEAGGQAQYARYDDRSANVWVNLPVGDNAALRATIYGRKSDGYVLNVANGDHYANQDFYAGRLQGKLWAGERLQATVSVDYRKDDHFVNYPEVIRPGTGHGLANLFTVPPGVVVAVPGPYTENVDFAPTEKAERWGAAATVDYDLGGGYSLTSITGYRSNKTKDTADNDNGANPAFVGTAHVVFADTAKHVTQELRLSSPTGQRLTYVAGAYFLDMKINSFRSVAFPPPNTAQIFVDVHNKALAGYFDSQFAITDRLKLGAGVRYTNEIKHLNRFNQVSTGGGFTFLFGTFAAPRDRLESNNVSGRLSLNYDVTPGVNAYATFSRGYKSGGWNPDYTAGTTTFTPRFKDERVDNYELGAKALLLDRRLRLNAALFSMDFTNQQVQQQVGIRFDITNAGKSRIRGFEGDLAYRATDYLTLTAAGGYVDARYRDFTNCSGTLDCTGNRLINAPKWTASTTAELEAPLGSWGLLHGHAEYAYRGNFYAAVYNDKLDAAIGPDAMLVRPYHNVSASLGVAPKDDAWRATVFVDNLFNRANEAGRLLDGIIDVNTLSANYYPPRVVGVRFDVKLRP
jgi:iron complex outermembrane receptor protein